MKVDPSSGVMGAMKVTIKNDADEAARHVAGMLADHLTITPATKLGLATGETMRPVYGHVRKLISEGQVPTDAFTSFNLDEFIGVPKTHPGSFHAFMARELFGHIADVQDRCFLPDGLADDPAVEAVLYEAEIAARGGIDMQLLGIGRNGHIGFNEPGTPFDSRTAPVKLSPETRRVMQGFDAEKPDMAITMGIGTIMQARRCLLLATGKAKAAAVSAMLEESPSTACPASALQEHPDTLIVLDRQAASRLHMVNGHGFLDEVSAR